MERISDSVMIGAAICAVVAFVLPIALLVWYRIKSKCKLMPALVGAMIFVVFSQVLEGIPKYIFFAGANEVSRYVLSHAWAYTLIGCLLAGIFEEIGRYTAFRIYLKKYTDKKNAIMYGIGHGGIEAILVVGVTMLSVISLAMIVNGGGLDAVTAGYSAEQMSALQMQIDAISSYNAIYFVEMILERILAITIHISLSVLVFRAVHDKGKGIWLLYAIVLHAFVDIPAALYQCSVVSLPVCEGITIVLTLLLACISRKAYKEYQ